MQLAPTTVASTTATTAGPRGPRFSGGIEFNGTSEKFSNFTARSKGGAYGDEAGYETLNQAVDALTMLTAGIHMPAAGVFERDGRFYGRQLENTVTFNSGATWTGMWRLEQHPSDLALLTGAANGTTTRVDALRAVVDGAQRVLVDHLPVAKQTKPKG